MSDFWMIGLSGAALYLRANGFSWGESDRLLRLKLRYDRGEFRVMWTKPQITGRLLVREWHEGHQSHHRAARLTQPAAAQSAEQCRGVVPLL